MLFRSDGGCAVAARTETLWRDFSFFFLSFLFFFLTVCIRRAFWLTLLHRLDVIKAGCNWYLHNIIYLKKNGGRVSG